MASSLEPCGVVREYRDLMAVIVRERMRRRMSQLEVDHRAGLQEGYTGKLEKAGTRYGRYLGPVSMPLLLEALGLAIVVVRVRPGRRMLREPVEQMALRLIGGGPGERTDPIQPRLRPPKPKSPQGEKSPEKALEAA